MLAAAPDTRTLVTPLSSVWPRVPGVVATGRVMLQDSVAVTQVTQVGVVINIVQGGGGDQSAGIIVSVRRENIVIMRLESVGVQLEYNVEIIRQLHYHQNLGLRHLHP